MMIDTIITLDNNTNYLLLDVTELDGRKIFYAVKVNSDLSSPTKEYAFIEEIDRGGDIFTKMVTDKESVKYLATVFVNNYIDVVESKKTGD